MKGALLVAAALALLAVVSAVPMMENDPLAQEFSQWAAKFEKVYENAEEKAKRFALWSERRAEMEAHNAAGKKYTLGMNHMSDWTEEEYKRLLGFRGAEHKPRSSEPFTHASVTDVPDSVDWRTKGAVTPIKNQEQCGSCWAFSAIGAIEGAVALKTGKTWPAGTGVEGYSEQQLVACAGDEGCMGCNGGLMDLAFKHVIAKGGVDSEKDWSYVGVDTACNNAKEALEQVAAIKSYVDVPKGDANALMQALSQQPVSVGIDAQCSSFMQYSGGIMTESCGTQLDHGVLAVGYNKTGQYWIVKNSWGTVWGEEGYFRLSMSGGGLGLDGILQAASYPVAADKQPSGNVPENTCADSTTTCPQGSTCCCTRNHLLSKKCADYDCCFGDAPTCKPASGILGKGQCTK